MFEPADDEVFLCRHPNKTEPSLPSWARLPINRCNLPAVILGSVTFQHHPTSLILDGVTELHDDLFALLDGIDDAAERATLFCDYLAVHFCFDRLEEAGFDAHTGKRAKADWRRLLRGWSFDADGREGAVLKGWVESRFGLLPRFHGAPLRDFDGPAWRRYEQMRAAGLYGTNALEAQLDLVYTWCQYEFRRRHPGQTHMTLHRGVNRFTEHEVLDDAGRQPTVLLNNLVSFTSSRERAGEFGDFILTARVPVAKIFFHCDLLPGVLQGEGEHLVIGGAYEVTLATL
ncbi:NAD(+)--dinitrogen-reductase ADP-D-ribosyltransferase [Caldichromatium japonicum]|uniref:NAD(+)--dinitrogen-reductase ADP-D-ribosyltransferase n=1 Tax=Caldichromatium japonicum TaxID=2699430 RepID=A0A6G7VHA2_9GAMM|nr:NAD(+)--dinitrogen-reductase ADP-D-ribosyltransferase [Caldichromatium japonicum]